MLDSFYVDPDSDAYYINNEQRKLIYQYREKWQNIAFSTARIDRDRAREAIQQIYRDIQQPKPKVIFGDSPYEVLTQIPNDVGASVLEKIIFWCWQLTPPLPQIVFNLPIISGYFPQDYLFRVNRDIYGSLDCICESSLREELYLEIGHPILKTERLASDSAYLDFYFSLLKLNSDAYARWKTWKQLSSQSGWIIPFENVCFICDRPVEILRDRQQQIHADHVPAVKFLDGFEIYAYRGRYIPKKYSQLHPHNWQFKWLFESLRENLEIVNVLITESGYDEILQKLEARTISSMETVNGIYRLIAIDLDINVQNLKALIISGDELDIHLCPAHIDEIQQAIEWLEEDGEIE